MFSKNSILITMKTSEGGSRMNTQKAEDIKDIALKLNAIKNSCPDDYFYLKGWIHCLLQKEGTNDMVSRSFPKKKV